MFKPSHCGLSVKRFCFKSHRVCSNLLLLVWQICSQQVSNPIGYVQTITFTGYVEIGTAGFKSHRVCSNSIFSFAFSKVKCFKSHRVCSNHEIAHIRAYFVCLMKILYLKMSWFANFWDWKIACLRHFLKLKESFIEVCHIFLQEFW